MLIRATRVVVKGGFWKVLMKLVIYQCHLNSLFLFFTLKESIAFRYIFKEILALQLFRKHTQRMIFRKIALIVTVNETNEFACIILQKPANLQVKLIRTIIALHSYKKKVCTSN